MPRKELLVDFIREHTPGNGVQIQGANSVTIAYTTVIPFNNVLTIITGKTLATTDVFTIAANPIEGGGAQVWLDGDGSHSPDLSAFDYQSGTYSTTSGIRNLITMEYLGGKTYVSILNMSAI